ncbi:MAG: discoidin domain-containing protein, partial [Acidobacteriota bacterium]|nr:discoidin domain-containing protein [Acidobacteriota bacterium]
PPREYNWKQHNEERIVHQFPQLEPGQWVTNGNSPRGLPTDEDLVAWRQFAKVLVLHLEFWDGFGVRHIKPKDPVRFRQVVDLAHELGYLVLPYSSPYYYQPALEPGGKLRPDAVAVYLEEARWLLDEYKVDGLYWDGEFMDILQAWECTRETRKLLGDRRLYVHCTTMPLPYTELYCPFVNTWADYLLRGEGQPRPTVDETYLRYVVSGYNISNAIGELCYDGCRVDRTVADWAVRSNARIPYWPGLQVHGGRKYFLDPGEEEVFRNYYLPAADQVKGPADYAPLAAVSRRELTARRAQLEAEDRAAHQALADYLNARREEFGPRVADNLAAFRSGECQDFVRRRSGPHRVGYPPEYATDQNAETYWGADFLPQWATIDLGGTEIVSRIRLQTYFGDKRYYHYRVEVSTDNETWQLVGEKADNALSTESGDEYRFAPRQARYVRVTILHNSANNAGHIVELGVYR